MFLGTNSCISLRYRAITECTTKLETSIIFLLYSDSDMHNTIVVGVHKILLLFV